MNIGDSVKFVKLLSDNHADWGVTPLAFNYIQKLVGQVGHIEYIQKHYEDDGTKTFYIDVRFSCGYILKRANSIAFKINEN